MGLDRAHLRDARGARGMEREETDCPRAEHDRDFGRDEPAREPDGMDRVREWLDERTRARIDTVGQRHEVGCGDSHALSEAARDVHADEAPPRAEIALARLAACAEATRKERVHRNTAPGPLASRSACGDDGPGELMSHDERRRSVGHPSEVALDLGPADARCLRHNDDLAVTVPGFIDGLDRDLPRTTPDQGTHGTAG